VLPSLCVWDSTSVHPIPVSVAVLSTHGAFTRWCANMHLADSQDTTPLTTLSHVPLSPRELKEPAGLSRSDCRRPDGLTLITWQGGRPLVWDVTVATTLADSYVSASAALAGAAAETAATRKSVKYADLPAS